jgi:hypothetical protein
MLRKADSSIASLYDAFLANLRQQKKRKQKSNIHAMVQSTIPTTKKGKESESPRAAIFFSFFCLLYELAKCDRSGAFVVPTISLRLEKNPFDDVRGLHKRARRLTPQPSASPPVVGPKRAAHQAQKKKM